MVSDPGNSWRATIIAWEIDPVASQRRFVPRLQLFQRMCCNSGDFFRSDTASGSQQNAGDPHDVLLSTDFVCRVSLSRRCNLICYTFSYA